MPESTTTVIETTYKCPICGTELIIYEDDAGSVLFGCERCELYVTTNKAAKKYRSALFTRPTHRFILQEILDSMYNSFVELATK